MTKLSLLAALSLAIGACVIVDDDDGGGSETSNSSNATTQSTTATTASSNSGTDGSSSGSSASSESTAADSGTSAGGGGCGWGPTGEADVPEGYVCGGNGEDPSGMIPSTCPEGIELVEGGDCGGNMGITGVGCCDASGNAWFCAGQDGASQLYTQPC